MSFNSLTTTATCAAITLVHLPVSTMLTLHLLHQSIFSSRASSLHLSALSFSFAYGGLLTLDLRRIGAWSPDRKPQARLRLTRLLVPTTGRPNVAPFKCLAGWFTDG